MLKKIKEIDHADIVIGHNSGAIYPALVACKKLNCPVGFDVEDYHPGEGNNRTIKTLTLQLFKKTFYKFDYVSFASELIKNRVEKEMGINSKNWVTVLNYFPSDEFLEPLNEPTGKVKFVWFSQNITSGRGLEEFLSLFDKLKDCELHLYGNLDKQFFDNRLSQYDNIIIHKPLSQKQLHAELINYDIGLALDLANDENRDLAITNKILAYLQSGLFVVASGISAHRFILDQHPENGICLTDSDNVTLLKNLLKNIVTIRANRNKRHQNLKSFCWENESVLLENKWNQLIN
ncbi:MAG: glycosyltransferase family 4 protein [Ferruginibacter sp.]|nr:glycosyltransferase family 4 protein [Ferruginibacter sp.]